ncbi:MAG TPA: carbohydrate binding domain-containing protein, partial [Chthonomonadaceae bacterium]|nr:carbohydrate binding domain-containing protein [Chthonomonadaceae bacterium]
MRPLLFPLLLAVCLLAPAPGHSSGGRAEPDAARMKKRWLFVWRDMADPKEVDRMIARFPRARADGYNGVVFSYNVPAAKAAELREAAKRNGLDLVAIVMGGSRDKNYMEGVLSKDTPFVAKGGLLVHELSAVAVKNADFEAANGNHFTGWNFQDDEGVTTFADREVTHGGKMSLRMQDIHKNEARHCRIHQRIRLTPHREYRISFWLKTENLAPADAEVKILSPDAGRQVSFQTFHVNPTQGWTHYDLAFNSLDYSDANLYLGTWNGRDGKMWWDDFQIEEIGLVNALRRPGCPVTVRGENGVVYQEGRDYEKIVDPLLHPWQAYHEPPRVRL